MTSPEISRGIPVVVSAPSGAGKTTLCRRLIARLDKVAYSVSHTTRKPRGKEQHGVDYFFVDDAAFDQMVAEDGFLEWAHVHAHRYGTGRAQAEQQLSRGMDLLFDIDVQGGKQISERLSDALLLFVLPPDLATLERRLRGRASDSEEQVQRRLAAARQEIKAAQFYSHFLVNDDLDQAVAELEALLVAERKRRVDKQALLARFS